MATFVSINVDDEADSLRTRAGIAAESVGFARVFIVLAEVLGNST